MDKSEGLSVCWREHRIVQLRWGVCLFVCFYLLSSVYYLKNTIPEQPNERDAQGKVLRAEGEEWLTRSFCALPRHAALPAPQCAHQPGGSQKNPMA